MLYFNLYEIYPALHTDFLVKQGLTEKFSALHVYFFQSNVTSVSARYSVALLLILFGNEHFISWDRIPDSYACKGHWQSPRNSSILGKSPSDSFYGKTSRKHKSHLTVLMGAQSQGLHLGFTPTSAQSSKHEISLWVEDSLEIPKNPSLKLVTCLLCGIGQVI